VSSSEELSLLQEGSCLSELGSLLLTTLEDLIVEENGIESAETDFRPILPKKSGLCRVVGRRKVVS